MILHMIHILSSNPPLYIVRSLHLIAPNEKYQVGICCVLWRVHCEACQWYWRAFWVWCLQDTWLITSTRGSWRMKINLGMLLTVCIFCPLLDCGPAPLIELEAALCDHFCDLDPSSLPIEDPSRRRSPCGCNTVWPDAGSWYQLHRDPGVRRPHVWWVTYIGDTELAVLATTFDGVFEKYSYTFLN